MARIQRTRVNGRASSTPPVSHAKADNDDDDSGAATDDDTSAVPPPVDALSEMMASLQGASTSRISIYRIVKNQPPSYVCECDPASFSLDDLRDKYNGGEFRLYVMKDGRLWKNMRVIVEPKQIIHTHDPAPPTQTASGEVLALIREGFAAQAAALREALTARNGPSMFAGMDLPAVITAAAAAITALRPPPPPAAPPSDNTSQALDMFMKGMQIATDLRDSAPSADNSIGGMLRDVLRSPILAGAIQQTLTAPAPARAAGPALPRPQQPPPAAPPQPEVSHAKTPTTEESAMLTHYLNYFVQKAAAGADPVLYAEVVLDNLGDDQLNPMMARGPLLIDDFIAACPSVEQHRAWFESLIQAVTDAMTATDEPDAAASELETQHATATAPAVVSGNPA